MRSPSADEWSFYTFFGNLQRIRVGGNVGRGFQDGREADNVVAPKNGFELAEVSFGQICASVYRAIVDASDFERKRIGLRGNQEICAEAAKFTREAIPDVERHAQRSGGHGHT